MEISNGDVALHLAVDGDEDAPPVLLLHGITMSLDTWDWFVGDLIAYGYRVLRLDFRGHGRSGRAPGSYTFADYLTDAAQACLQVARRPCAVVGHSLGGGTAAGLAQTMPDLVRAIVLEDAPLAKPQPVADGALMAGFRLWRESMPRLQARGIELPALVELLCAAAAPSGEPFGELIHADGIEAMATAMLRCDASVLDPVLEGRMEPVYDAAQPVLVPTLALAADPASPDAVTGPEDLVRIGASGPHVTTRVMSGSGHLMHDQLDQRDRYRDIVLEFLSVAAPA
jgi:pimeloyl-ACP methyl ester carboxylesterase